jgi:hypothetical protein
MAGAARRPIATVQGKRNAMRKVRVQIANVRRFEQLCKVLRSLIAKTVREALPKNCRNDKKKEVLRRAPLDAPRGQCAYCRICELAMVTAIAVPVKFW